MTTDMYGFHAGELVRWRAGWLFGRVVGRTSAEGRLLVSALVNGRYQVLATRPQDILSLTQEAQQ